MATRYKQSEPRLGTLEQARKLMVESATLSIREIARQARDLADRYFLTMHDKISNWANEYEIETSVGFPPKFEPIVKEVVDALKGKIEEDIAGWVRTTLLPMIQEKLRALEQSLEGRALSFFETADQIRIDLSMGCDVNASSVAESMKPSRGVRILAIGDAILRLDPISAGA